MGSIADKLNTILNTKNNFKQKFNEKGVTVDDSVPFSEYPNKMDEIGGNTLINTSVAQQIKKAVMPNNIFSQQEIINSASAEIETA